jgi:hypothetical protein
MRTIPFFIALLFTAFFAHAQSATITVEVSNVALLHCQDCVGLGTSLVAYSPRVTPVSSLDSVSFEAISADKKLWKARVPNDKTDKLWILIAAKGEKRLTFFAAPMTLCTSSSAK